MNALAARARDLLTGEPARFIFYGAAIVVWLVVAIANRLNIVTFGPNISLTDAMTQATLAGAALTEVIRHFVYSPNSVAAIVNTPPTAAGPIAAAEAAGVDTTPVPVP